MIIATACVLVAGCGGSGGLTGGGGAAGPGAAGRGGAAAGASGRGGASATGGGGAAGAAGGGVAGTGGSGGASGAAGGASAGRGGGGASGGGGVAGAAGVTGAAGTGGAGAMGGGSAESGGTAGGATGGSGGRGGSAAGSSGAGGTGGGAAGAAGGGGGGAAGAGGGTVGPCGVAACVGSNWAQWPMPNAAADVANGAPHPAMLIDNGDDTVTDGVTGLTWQRTASITFYNRAEAAARCQRLRTGAHADWRVPSAIELASIINFDRFSSSIDTVAFPDSPLDPTPDPRVPIAYFGTTTVAGSAGWLVSFVYGNVSLDTTSLDRGAYLRCVRGPTAPAVDTSAGRYDLSVTGTARDVKTGLTWQRVAPTTGRRKLADAKTYCATGTGLSGTGWRLPTVKELLTLVDFTKPSGFRIDQTVFNVPTDIGDPYGVCGAGRPSPESRRSRSSRRARGRSTPIPASTIPSTPPVSPGSAACADAHHGYATPAPIVNVSFMVESGMAWLAHTTRARSPPHTIWGASTGRRHTRRRTTGRRCRPERPAACRRSSGACRRSPRRSRATVGPHDQRAAPEARDARGEAVADVDAPARRRRAVQQRPGRREPRDVHADRRRIGPLRPRRHEVRAVEDQLRLAVTDARHGVHRERRRVDRAAAAVRRAAARMLAGSGDVVDAVAGGA